MVIVGIDARGGADVGEIALVVAVEPVGFVAVAEVEIEVAIAVDIDPETHKGIARVVDSALRSEFLKRAVAEVAVQQIGPEVPGNVPVLAAVVVEIARADAVAASGGIHPDLRGDIGKTGGLRGGERCEQEK